MSDKYIKIIHLPSNTIIAKGTLGWSITPFEGNYYVSKKCLFTDGFRINFFPGLCIYKFLYVWLDFVTPQGEIRKNFGWMYWLPNPLFPFIWFRVAIPQEHPEIRVEKSNEL